MMWYKVWPAHKRPCMQVDSQEKKYNCNFPVPPLSPGSPGSAARAQPVTASARPPPPHPSRPARPRAPRSWCTAGTRWPASARARAGTRPACSAPRGGSGRRASVTRARGRQRAARQGSSHLSDSSSAASCAMTAPVSSTRTPPPSRCSSRMVRAVFSRHSAAWAALPWTPKTSGASSPNS